MAIPSRRRACQLLAFGSPLLSSQEPQSAELLIGAAADLSAIGPRLAAAFQARNGPPSRWTFGSSHTLARQLRNGAPFDLLLLANRAYLDELARDRVVEPATVRVYARGRLAFWSKKGLAWSDLATPKVRYLAIANPAFAPYGQAAREALESRGLWAALQPKIVLAENVRQAFQFAETGNADAALVAWSLVFDRAGAAIDESWHKPLEQACAVSSRAKQPAAARRFLDFLLAGEGLRLLESGGFQAPAARPKP